MENRKNILILVLVVVFVVTLSGCSTSADSLVDARIKLLPRARTYIGKNAEKVEEKATAATTARAAMKEEVATTSTDVTTIMNAFNPDQ